MRILRLAAAIVGALALSPVFATTALADPPYPPTEPGLTASSMTDPDGGQDTFHGDGFDAHELVVITDTDHLLADGANTRAAVPDALAMPESAKILRIVETNAQGSFTVAVRLDEVGANTITATGERSHRSVSIVVDVLSPSGSSGGGGNGGGGNGGGGNGGGGNGGVGTGSSGLPRTGVDTTPFIIGGS
jgi:hypothetical protein